ncbi:hypothetical protein LshimejAT787_0401180 [Lyophyllum shimeji]|uniref:Uncharacterized protein n=1 Tax=Lyophyllum shimeji TaxID=47721 RepID=A0A9P3PKN0_LYOSH|nr:hypothetical protein LshimejAT787_0401180 [Lyophyllum shimeji]
MRKGSYIIAFFVVLIAFILVSPAVLDLLSPADIIARQNILSQVRPDWLVVRSAEVLHTRIVILYGLSQRCERQITRIPGPNGGERYVYTDFECRDFPMKVRDRCEQENASFCAAWSSARYLNELAVWCAAVTLVAIAFGVTTHSRRRRIWRVVAGLVLLHFAFQVAAFGIVTDMYRRNEYPTFEHARVGPAYIFNVLAWILSLLVGVAVITTGVAADKGHRWAAGRRPYHPISDVVFD